MKIGYFPPSEEFSPGERRSAPQRTQLQCMSEAALRVLRRHSSIRSREPMISREGVRAQTLRTRSIMKDQFTGAA